MPPVEVSFSGFVLVGVTLLILALTIAVYLFRRPKTRAAWLLMGFFAAVAVSGLMTILTNAYLFWGPLFDPWQDVFVLLGGASLGLFAYHFPSDDQPREARIMGAVLLAVVLVAFAYAARFDLQFAFAYTPGLDVADAFYVLLPLGTMLTIFIFLRRSAHYSALALAESGQGNQPTRSFAWRVFHPQGQSAKSLIGFALALLLGFLPGLSVLLPVPDPFDFLALNIGSLLALATLALVYFNYAPEMTSFMAKLVGITLLTLLIVLSVVGSINYRSQARQYDATALERIAFAHAGLVAQRSTAIPPGIAYIAAWAADAPADAGRYQSLYVRADVEGFSIDRLIAQNQRGDLEAHGEPVVGELARLTDASWQRIRRYHTFPSGSSMPDFVGWVFTRGATAYEIGLATRDRERYLSGLTIAWTTVIAAVSLIVLVLFPRFFRRNLVNPLAQLLDGVSRVKQGDLSATVPVQYRDEIGSLTGSFNTLTRTLEASYDSLEQRVADRTRELSTFTDLAMLPSEDEDLQRALEPALARVLEAIHSDMLALHLVNHEASALELFAQRNLPSEAAMRLRSIALTPDFVARLVQGDAVLTASARDAASELPEPFVLAGDWTYIGCPLVAAGEPLGWLSCYRASGAPFSPSETTFLMAIARQLGVMVENQRLRQRIGQVAVIEERQRLARDLHDSVTQLLYSLTLFSRAGADAAADGDAARLRLALESTEATSLQALREMRSLLYQLQPPTLEERGLARVLADRVDAVERRVGIEVDFHADEAFRVQEDVERELYFVTTEALNNSLKHARATRLAIRLERVNSHVEIRIADNGRGFAPLRKSGGLGLQNMRERIERLGGKVEIASKEDEGTSIRIVAPVGHST